jgi:hypothetical protein
MSALIQRVDPKPIANPPIAREDIVFGHPSERELAQVLDFYGIEWRYEPTTFPLDWDDEGHVTEAFAPDFYLVQEDLYVELTTLRPKLMRAKHRKLRRMGELYPDVNIKLWRRRDFLRLLERFGMDGRQQELVGQDAVKR